MAHSSAGLLAIALLSFATLRTLGVTPTPGSLDLSFDPGSSFSPVNASIPIRVVFPLPDGSILLGGFFTNYGGFPRKGIAKTTEDGAIDQSFVPDPIFNTPNTELWSIAQQPDGKIITAGISDSIRRARIYRLNADGSLDSTFSFSDPFAGFAMAVDVRPDNLVSYITDRVSGLSILKPDGKHLLSSGGVTPFAAYNLIARSPEGHTFYTDQTGIHRFGGTFGLPDDPIFPSIDFNYSSDFDFQSDGSVISIGDEVLRRYRPNGVGDQTFRLRYTGSQLLSVATLPDDKILLGGAFTTIDTIARRNFARLNSNGALDTNFITGAGPNGEVNCITPVRNGKALIAGEFTSYDGISRTGIARIFLDPPAPPTFITQPKPTNILAPGELRLSVAVNAAPGVTYQWRKNNEPIEGATNALLYIPRATATHAGTYSVVVTTPSGQATSDDAIVNMFQRFPGPGVLDVNFATGEAASRSVNAILPLPSGKTLIGGDFFAYDGQLRPALVRLNADGSLDTSLDYNLPPGTTCQVLAVEAEGKILAGLKSVQLTATTYSQTLRRLNPDGSPDAAFLPGASEDLLTSILPLPNGKMLLGYVDSNPNGTVGRPLSRRNADGSFDESFTREIQLDNAYALLAQPDGKILAALKNRIVRLHPDGAIDTTIPLNEGFTANARVLLAQPDGKILVGGRFTSIAGVARTNLARLNEDLTVDLAFTSDTTGSTIRALALQPHGKILVAGNFRDLAGAACTNIGRIMTNGAFDATFFADVGFPAPSTRPTVNALSITDNQTLTFGGLFSRVNNHPRNSIARINLTMPLHLQANAQLSAATPTLKLNFALDPSFDHKLQYSETLPPTWQDLQTINPNTTSIEEPLTNTQRYYRLLQTLR